MVTTLVNIVQSKELKKLAPFSMQSSKYTLLPFSFMHSLLSLFSHAGPLWDSQALASHARANISHLDGSVKDGRVKTIFMINNLLTNYLLLAQL